MSADSSGRARRKTVADGACVIRDAHVTRDQIMRGSYSRPRKQEGENASPSSLPPQSDRIIPGEIKNFHPVARDWPIPPLDCLSSFFLARTGTEIKNFRTPRSHDTVTEIKN